MSQLKSQETKNETREDDAAQMITVEVAYAQPERQRIIKLEVEAGCTAWEAAQRSGIDKVFPEINFETSSMGVFSQIIADPRAYVLKGGDRVEIYRSLIADPKEVRRARAAEAKKRRAEQT